MHRCDNRLHAMTNYFNKETKYNNWSDQYLFYIESALTITLIYKKQPIITL